MPSNDLHCHPEGSAANPAGLNTHSTKTLQRLSQMPDKRSRPGQDPPCQPHKSGLERKASLEVEQRLSARYSPCALSRQAPGASGLEAVVPPAPDPLPDPLSAEGRQADAASEKRHHPETKGRVPERRAQAASSRRRDRALAHFLRLASARPAGHPKSARSPQTVAVIFRRSHQPVAPATSARRPSSSLAPQRGSRYRRQPPHRAPCHLGKSRAAAPEKPHLPRDDPVEADRWKRPAPSRRPAHRLQSRRDERARPGRRTAPARRRPRSSRPVWHLHPPPRHWIRREANATEIARHVSAEDYPHLAIHTSTWSRQQK